MQGYRFHAAVSLHHYNYYFIDAESNLSVYSIS